MRTRNRIACGLAALSLVAAGCGEEESDEASGDSAAQKQETTQEAPQPQPAAKVRAKPKVAKPTGAAPRKLVKQDLEKGTGPPVKAGDQIEVNYVGVTFKDGKEFDSSFDAGQPFQFMLGASEVIPGWDRGLEGMRVGGRRRLTIPPDLAYGAQGSPPAIGPNETLVFVIDLLRKG